MSGTIALRTTAPFPTFIVGTPPITIGFAPTGNQPPAGLELETLQIAGHSPKPLTTAAYILLNNAVLTWKHTVKKYDGTLGLDSFANSGAHLTALTNPDIQVRVAELSALIAGGYEVWSNYGVSPYNADNGPALSALPTGMMIFADTPGNLPIASRWNLQSGLCIVSDHSNVLTSTYPNQPNNSFLQGLISQPGLTTPDGAVPGTGIGPGGTYQFIDSIYLFGLNIFNTNVLNLYSVFAFNATNFQLLYCNMTNYASAIFYSGANIEIAYCTGTTSGAINPVAGGGPATRLLGTTNDFSRTPSNPVPTTRKAAVWVHDCNMQAYDGIYQIAPNKTVWGSGTSFYDVLHENCVGTSVAGPLVLATGILSGTDNSNYNFTKAHFVNMNAIASVNGLSLACSRNPAGFFQDILFKNITITRIGLQTVLGTAKDPVSGNVVLTVDSTFGTVNGEAVLVSGVTGTVEANGTWLCILIDATHIALPVQWLNAWAGGGTVTDSDATSMINALSLPQVDGVAGGTIFDVTYDTCHMMGIRTDAFAIEGPWVTGPILFTNCTFDQPQQSTSRYPGRILYGASNITLQNSSLGMQKSGLDIGTPVVMTVTRTWAAANGEVVLGVSSVQGANGSTSSTVGDTLRITGNNGTPTINGVWTTNYSLSVSLISIVFGTARDPATGNVILMVDTTLGAITGDTFVVAAVGGTTGANGTWTNCTVIDATHIQLTGSNWNAAWTSGGQAADTVDSVQLHATTWNSSYSSTIGSGTLGRLIDLNPAPMNVLGTAAAGNNEIILTLDSAKNVATNDVVVVAGVTGTSNANGTWTVHFIDGTHVQLTGTTFNAAWLGGGTLTNTTFTTCNNITINNNSMATCQLGGTAFLLEQTTNAVITNNTVARGAGTVTGCLLTATAPNINGTLNSIVSNNNFNAMPITGATTTQGNTVSGNT